MKFLVDAQLPKSLSALLENQGFNTLHTLDLPERNATKDGLIARLAKEQDRVVITKDSDFLKSFIIKKEPPKLLLLKTGNMKNQGLLSLFEKNLTLLQKLFKHHDLVEMTREEIIVHQ
ncbi:DUF5615 family PIN-like protein [Rufibacter sp. LB8]|uniref:DUF5615 family PIN-like protein n=1 Tax=Rufibacter sp. LB8 TaxID=2777781 RepID=UPI00178C3F54|nr:DUF5615 family PIN-like protein [Rufibacter sp. LB8]